MWINPTPARPQLCQLEVEKPCTRPEQHLHAVGTYNLFMGLFGGGFHPCSLVLTNVMKKMYWLISGIIFLHASLLTAS